MPLIKIGDRIELRTKAGEPLGELIVEENCYGAWCGPFTPASGYPGVRDLFAEWTILVNAQGFNALVAVDEKIALLGISAVFNGEPLPVHAIQISDEGDQIHGCFRLAG
jgi:hypothetical protein